MREDQLEKLQALSEELTDVFLFEANPKEWPGHGVLPKDLTKDERGDAYWAKKNAVATMAIVVRIESLTARLVNPRGKDTEDEGEDSGLDKEVADAEKQAKAMLAQVMKRAERAVTHGKP